MEGIKDSTQTVILFFLVFNFLENQPTSSIKNQKRTSKGQQAFVEFLYAKLFL